MYWIFEGTQMANKSGYLLPFIIREMQIQMRFINITYKNVYYPKDKIQEALRR